MIFKNILFAILLGLSDAETNAKKTARGIREKAFDIIETMVQYDENIALSPLSIIGAMYMLAAGSAGNSRAEILKALNFGDSLSSEASVNAPFEAYNDLISGLQTQPDNGYILKIANGMFHQENMASYTPSAVGAEYVDLLQKQFIKDSTNIQSVDFKDGSAATDRINAWVNETTKGKIPKLFEEPLGSETLVILASSLYFKASWTQKFRLIPKDSKQARDLCWANSKEDLLGNVCNDNVQWMKKEDDVSLTEIKQGYKRVAQIIDIPMKSRQNKNGQAENKFTMQIWLPEDYITTEEMDNEFREIVKDNVGSIRKKMTKQKVNIVMPKFDIDYKDGIIPALRKLGIEDVFGNADLSPMLGTGTNAFVSQVTHAVKLTVDEKGVEGAAVTAVQISSRTFSQPELVQVNKPFYFVISNRCWVPESKGKPCDSGNVPLFIGRFVKP